MTASALLLDIEGTVTPISFVHDVLFPFARQHVREFLIQHLTEPEVKKDLDALAAEHSQDRAANASMSSITGSEGFPPAAPIIDSQIDSVVAYVNWLIDRDRKSQALKSLQGKIWEEGYRSGTLKAPLFDDVVPNLKRLRSKGTRVAIFSSGSVLAQKLLFAHTETGDHSDLIDEYFDTEVGSKVTAGSYEEIAKRLGLSPFEIVFISDVTKELKAAHQVGMETLLCVRPGNSEQDDSEQFQVIHDFSELVQ